MNQMLQTVLDYVPYGEEFAIQATTTDIDLRQKPPVVEQTTRLLTESEGVVRAFANEDLAAHYVLNRAIHGNAKVAANLVSLMNELNVDVTRTDCDENPTFDHALKNHTIDTLHSLYDVGFVTIGERTQELLRGENISA